MTNKNLKPCTAFGPRNRKSPYFDATRRYGFNHFTLYNHMYMPLLYDNGEIDYWKLINDVTLWDVAAERQVEIVGKDAFTLAQAVCPRDLSTCEIGQGLYIPMIDAAGGMINDPLLLRLADDRFWLSLADSDILLWVKGIATAQNYAVKVFEPDASPLAIQGPKAKDLIVDVFGDWAGKLKYFWFKETELDGIPMLLARSGWSKQGGYEIYLTDRTKGDALWDKMMQAGKPYGIAPASPNLIERIESGLLSYRSDMDERNNPLEMGLDRFVDLDTDADYIGKQALRRIKAEGIKRKHIGLKWGGDIIPPNEHHWSVFKGDSRVGKLTSSVYSPRIQKNIALSILDIEHAIIGNRVTIKSPHGRFEAEVVAVPFEIPNSQ